MKEQKYRIYEKRNRMGNEMINSTYKRNRQIQKLMRLLLASLMLCTYTGCTFDGGQTQTKSSENRDQIKDMPSSETGEEQDSDTETGQDEESTQAIIEQERIDWDDSWEFASYSEIHEDPVMLYRSTSKDRKDVVIAVNAGHGTPGGDTARTLCHPDGTPKVTGGSTAAGEIYAPANSSGMTFLDGTDEAVVTLSLAKILKEKLLEAGYDVLMMRETDGCLVDNIARTVYANENADCHISLHYDSSEYDKGFFYISVPDIDSYRAMEPVASHWYEHIRLGEALLSGMKEAQVKIFGDGTMPIDLTQTSYSTVPSVDIEVGDRASDYSQASQTIVAQGIVNGVNIYFQRN